MADRYEISKSQELFFLKSRLKSVYSRVSENFTPAQNLGGSGGGGTPDPIPNSAVKPSSADGSPSGRE